SLPLVAYTASLPKGFSATFSVEQGNYRGGGIDAADAYSTAAFEQDSSMPDFVGALGQTTDWGRYQLSAALHRVKIYSGTEPGSADAATWGYAVQGGVMIEMPMIAANDSIYLQSAYVDGAISYLGLVNPSGDFAPPDAYYSATGGLSRVTGWNVTAQYLHNWTPTLNSAVFGGYANFKLHDAVAQASYGGSGANNFNIGANLVWSPTSKTTFVAQYIYNHYSANDYVDTSNGLPQSSQDAHDLLLMAQYTF
ncbi:MAG TPA: porin, partial [Kaistia sp.]|nr:porin [Kaistia sp.]